MRQLLHERRRCVVRLSGLLYGFGDGFVRLLGVEIDGGRFARLEWLVVYFNARRGIILGGRDFLAITISRLCFHRFLRELFSGL